MSTTLLTFQESKGWLNEIADSNIPDISVTALTSQLFKD